MWTVIFLTSKHKNDRYYFHYNLSLGFGIARVENLINISSNRIKEPFFINNKIATITKKDNNAILKIVKRYYAFENVNNKNKRNKKTVSTKPKEKENCEKVLT